MMVRILMIIYIFIFSCKPVFAEPTPSITYLMNEPVSLLDWGLFQLKEAIDKHFIKEDINQFVTVNYDWDTNRILIRFYDLEEKVNMDDAKNYCEEFIHSFKLVLGVDSKSGKAVLGQRSLMSFAFSHQNYSSKNEPNNLYSELIESQKSEDTLVSKGRTRHKHAQVPCYLIRLCIQKNNTLT